ncbi:hypothetical protein C2E23DRAFT_577081 [Lenzites betulinus]|nr:hypothetical protein C2E23DRAFT_577081 [Lenzites betulinus]
MVAVIHAPKPILAYTPARTMDSTPTLPVPTRRTQRRKVKHYRDKTNATPQMLSLGDAAQRLYFGAHVLAAIVNQTSHISTSQTVAAISPPPAPLATLLARPTLNRRNAIRVLHPATSAKTITAGSENSPPLSDISNHPFLGGSAAFPSSQPLYLGNTLLALCASITEDFLDETEADVHDKPSHRQSEKPQTLRRKHSMCPLVKGGSIGSVGDFQVELAEVVSRSFPLPDVAQDTESTTSEELYSYLSHTASLVEVVDTGCPPPSPPLSIPSRTLTQIIKEYWIGKCRPRPASRGHPSLNTIDELPDADTHDIPMPSCQIFGHPMVRTKAKRPVRRPKMRVENENIVSGISISS